MDSPAAIAQLEAQGALIRELKQAKAPKDEIVEAVGALNALKVVCEPAVSARLAEILDAGDEGHPALADEAQRLRNLLPAKAKAASEKVASKSKKSKKAAERKRFDRTLHTESVRTQRKIVHLLASEGGDESFRYRRQLSTDADAFVTGKEVFFTEKWDGTTVQATRDGVFKRKELLQRGAKNGAGEAERYDIERIDLSDPACKYIAAACAPHLAAFKQLAPGLCVYFEAVGSRIAGSKRRFCRGVQPRAPDEQQRKSPGTTSQSAAGHFSDSLAQLDVILAKLDGSAAAPAATATVVPAVAAETKPEVPAVTHASAGAGYMPHPPNCSRPGSTEPHHGLGCYVPLPPAAAGFTRAAPEKQTGAKAGRSARQRSAAGAVGASGVDWATIRVFDFAKNQQFLPFEETVKLAAEYMLPLVHFEKRPMPPLQELMRPLCEAESAEGAHAERARAAGAEPWDHTGEADARLMYNGIAAELEGYVLRVPGEGEAVAKIRVEDMGKLAAT